MTSFNTCDWLAQLARGDSTHLPHLAYMVARLCFIDLLAQAHDGLTMRCTAHLTSMSTCISRGGGKHREQNKNERPCANRPDGVSEDLLLLHDAYGSRITEAFDNSSMWCYQPMSRGSWGRLVTCVRCGASPLLSSLLVPPLPSLLPSLPEVSHTRL